MEEPKIKAYGFLATVEFINKNYDEAPRKRIFGSLSPAAQSFMETAKKSQWASPSYSSELWSAIVKEHPEPTVAVEKLVAAGRYQGEYATNTYLRLLMKMLTVKMFAKKIPDFWSRDATFGKLILRDADKIDSGQLTLHFDDIKPFPYFGPICQGWFSFSLEVMGLKNLKVDLKDWTLQNPDPGELTFGISWSK